MAPSTPRSAARRLLAAIWFAAFAVLATALFFLPLSMSPRVALLYVVLPSISAAISGSLWGAAILDSSRINTYAASLLRGLGVSAGAYLIFAVFYACGLPLMEPLWSLRQAGNLFFFTLMFGLLLAGPMAVVAGLVAGATLFRFGRHILAKM